MLNFRAESLPPRPKGKRKVHNRGSQIPLSRLFFFSIPPSRSFLCLDPDPAPFFYEIFDIFCLIIEIGVMTYLLTIVSFDASQLATITLFSVLLNYFFVLALVHVYLDTLSPVFLELGRLMLSVCLTKIRLLCC